VLQVGKRCSAPPHTRSRPMRSCASTSLTKQVRAMSARQDCSSIIGHWLRHTYLVQRGPASRIRDARIRLSIVVGAARVDGPRAPRSGYNCGGRRSAYALLWHAARPGLVKEGGHGWEQQRAADAERA
jgi:hypothetical protein